LSTTPPGQKTLIAVSATTNTSAANVAKTGIGCGSVVVSLSWL
jgi:hypothetical protein